MLLTMSKTGKGYGKETGRYTKFEYLIFSTIINVRQERTERCNLSNCYCWTLRTVLYLCRTCSSGRNQLVGNYEKNTCSAARTSWRMSTRMTSVASRVVAGRIRRSTSWGRDPSCRERASGRCWKLIFYEAKRYYKCFAIVRWQNGA